MRQEFDYIIIGAGSAGCVLAHRLSEDPNCQVLLLEAGGSDWNPFIHMPAGLGRLTQFTSINWGYETQPQAALNERRLYWPRGKVLGGSSSINAMCYARGHRSDYDHWADLGNQGWSYDEVLPYFKRAEDQERGQSDFHGQGGPLSVSDLRHHNPLSDVFLSAAEQAGFPRNDDFNGETQRGFGFYQVTQRDGQRCSTAAGYLDPVKHRDNLTVLTHAVTHRLLLEDGAIVGLEVRRKNQPLQLRAKQEVLLSAGAINSPQVLLNSGIGPGDELADLGIKVQHELPGVGKNLQDHLDICTLVRCTQPITYDNPNELAIGLQYLLFHRGIGTSNIAEAGGFAVSSLATEDRPDLQLHFVPAMLDDHGRNQLDGNGMTIHACPLRPKSRGEITLDPDDTYASPLIEPNYLSAPGDMDLMVECVRVARRIFGADAFADYRGAEVFPGDDVLDREALEAFIRRKAETIYHPVGTCKMGDDEMAVVDAQLRVHGIRNLRVIDASIMPELVSGNTNAPTVMIAEKAADLIRGRDAVTAHQQLASDAA